MDQLILEMMLFNAFDDIPVIWIVADHFGAVLRGFGRLFFRRCPFYAFSHFIDVTWIDITFFYQENSQIIDLAILQKITVIVV